MAICPTCKKTIVLDDIAESLFGLRRRIYEAVAEAGADGISKPDLLAKVYRGRVVPISDALKVHISKLNTEMLVKHRLRIRASERMGWGGAGIYHLEET